MFSKVAGTFTKVVLIVAMHPQIQVVLVHAPANAPAPNAPLTSPVILNSNAPLIVQSASPLILQ